MFFLKIGRFKKLTFMKLAAIFLFLLLPFCNSLLAQKAVTANNPELNKLLREYTKMA